MTEEAFGISSAGYTAALGMKEERSGGQLLILGEIVGAFVAAINVRRVALPDECSRELFLAFGRVGIETAPFVLHPEMKDWMLPEAGGLYLGTPTIVGDRPLFGRPDPDEWSKDVERSLVRRLVSGFAMRSEARLIVAGLGSGDVTPEERMADLGGAEEIVVKRFSGFIDYVHARRIRS